MEIVCFSHLRWDFVFQRPQHLLTRFADHFRIFYIEEAVHHSEHDHYSEVVHNSIHIIKLHLKGHPHEDDVVKRQQSLLATIFNKHKISEYILWYYTPMALPFTSHLEPVVTVFDCMDELSAFKFAPASLKQLEKELLNKSDVVFTGGHSLYEAKKQQHRNIHSFPSSIDKKHFNSARSIKHDPADQANIPHPRFGFYGVLDERFDIDLVREVAEAKPEWQFVLIGPVVKIDPESLPKNKNIHYLGGKKYAELPSYLAGWDISMISFAMNESTKFISPTKTPEYLAGGKPVISTPIRDVVESYGKNGLVHIVNNAREFVNVAQKELASKDKKQWLQQVDKYLANFSWDLTVNQMREHIYKAIAQKQVLAGQKKKEKFTTTAAHYMLVKPQLPAAS
jgi:glycosyltransferase involved in cell wall biosynthesis